MTLLVKILFLWYSSLKLHFNVKLMSSKLILCQGKFQRSISLILSTWSLTYWCTVLCLTPFCVWVPELCLGRLKQRRYWKGFYCRSALKIMPCVKIIDAKTHEEDKRRRLLWSQRKKTQGLLLACVGGFHLLCAHYCSVVFTSVHESVGNTAFACTEEITLQGKTRLRQENKIEKLHGLQKLCLL